LCLTGLRRWWCALVVVSSSLVLPFFFFGKHVLCVMFSWCALVVDIG
jgi:hypothetical protein